jgi:WD repeat-containing protein 22
MPLVWLTNFLAGRRNYGRYIFVRSQVNLLFVSGGDDRRVLIWNVEQAVHGVCKPAAMRAQHISNIFCLGFDSTNSKVFSAGNDDQVIVHDAKT